MIFPEFKNIEILNELRNQYDPLAGLVRPHITLVFPFESQMGNEELTHILDARLSSLKSFELQLGGISKLADAFGNYLFLNVLQGAEEICYIHHALYNNEFKEFDIGEPYIPHITIGKLPSVQLLEKAFSSIPYIDETFRTIVHKISVEGIGDHEESTIVN